MHEALNALVALGGGTALVAAGNYSNSGQIYLHAASNITLEGAGRSTSITMANSSNCHFLNLDNCNNIIVKKLRVDGNQAMQTGSFYGIYMNGCTDCQAAGNTVHNFTYGGIGLTNCAGCKISNNTTDSNGSNFTVSGWGIIFNNNCQNCTADGNTCRGNRKWQIEASQNCSMASITNNLVSDLGLRCQGMILLYGGTVGCSVFGNTLDQTYVSLAGESTFGIEVYHECLSNIVSGNKLRSSVIGAGDTIAGIWIDTGSSNNVISQNMVLGGYNRGIGVSSWPPATACDNNIIQANTVSNCLWGLSVEGAAAAHNQLPNNTLSNDTVPIHDTGTGTFEANNVVS